RATPLLLCNDTPTATTYTLSLHDALPISEASRRLVNVAASTSRGRSAARHSSEFAANPTRAAAVSAAGLTRADAVTRPRSGRSAHGDAGRAAGGSARRDGRLAAAQLHDELDPLAAAVEGEVALAVEADGLAHLLQRE